ncbi:hypothetical protein NHX12_013489, partial [Muraenolepis orangiensis]
MEAGSSLGLKRRYEEVDHSSAFSTPKDSDDEVSSSDSGDSCDSLNPPSGVPFAPTSILRRHKPPPGGKRVRFDLVTVYYFPRRQGFTSVPSQGGSSLGMARHHSSIRHYTLGEFAREQDSSHRHTLRQHLRQEKLNARKMKLTHNGTPLPTKRRRALLRASGVARIDAREKCQVDRMAFPCGCSRDGCGNMAGRIEFNPLRVRTHYLHTVMKLGLQKRILGPGDSGDGEQYHRDILERENETAVLHLQSAEEQERREWEEASGLGSGGLPEGEEVEVGKEEDEAGEEQVLLPPSSFPAVAAVLCMANGQAELPPEGPSSLLYYQLTPVQPGG